MIIKISAWLPNARSSARGYTQKNHSKPVFIVSFPYGCHITLKGKTSVKGMYVQRLASEKRFEK